MLGAGMSNLRNAATKLKHRAVNPTMRQQSIMRTRVDPEDNAAHQPLPVVSLTLFLASLLTFLGSVGGTNSPSTSSLAGFQIDPCAVLVFGAGSLLLPQLVIAREGSLGAHDRPIGAAASGITALPLRVGMLITSPASVLDQATRRQGWASGGNEESGEAARRPWGR